MKWFNSEDKTAGVITAKEHLLSPHKSYKVLSLPENAIIFCMSKWEKIISENYQAEVYLENLKRFLGSSVVYKISGHPDWCMLHGGAGAPQMADTIETIVALGVKNILLVGMVGGFGDNINIGDVVIPKQILSEEGTSIHYIGENDFAMASLDTRLLYNSLVGAGFNVSECKTVTSDAVYRQTFFKEGYWRSLGCVGVDMEGSACLNVAKTLGAKASAVFVVSDKHPRDDGDKEKKWDWGITYEHRTRFIVSIIDSCFKNNL